MLSVCSVRGGGWEWGEPGVISDHWGLGLLIILRSRVSPDNSSVTWPRVWPAMVTWPVMSDDVNIIMVSGLRWIIPCELSSDSLAECHSNNFMILSSWVRPSAGLLLLWNAVFIDQVSRSSSLKENLNLQMTWLIPKLWKVNNESFAFSDYQVASFSATVNCH